MKIHKLYLKVKHYFIKKILSKIESNLSYRYDEELLKNDILSYQRKLKYYTNWVNLFNVDHETKVVTVGGQKYIMMPETESTISVGMTIDSTYQLYGYSIEFRDTKYNTPWKIYWNKKVYDSEYSATEAIRQINGHFDDWEFRIKPLFTCDQTQFRDYKLTQLILLENKE